MRRFAACSLVLAVGCGPGTLEGWPSFGDEGDATSLGESSTDSESDTSESSTSESSTSESSTSESSTSESSTSESTTDPECPPGTQDCPCEGGACEEGLACAEGLCHAGTLVCGSSLALRDARIADCPTKPWVADDRFGNEHDLRAEAFVYSGSLYYGRILLEFDLDAIPPGPLALASIELSPYTETPAFFHTHDGAPTNAAQLRPILSSWTEGDAEWNEGPTVGEPLLDLPAIDDPLAGLSIDITAIVLDMRERGDLGHGFAIQLADESPDTRLAFASDEALDEATRPRLGYCVVQ